MPKFTIQVEFRDTDVLEIYPTQTMLEWFRRNKKEINKVVIEGIHYELTTP